MSLDSKSSIQWICRKWVGNWALMNQTTSKVDSDDKKMKIDWFNLKKIILGTVRGDRFLYILLEFGYRYSFDCYNVSFSILRSSSSRSSFPFILSSFFPLYPPRIGQIAGIDPCPISIFLKSLRSSCKAERYCSGITSSLMWPES